MTSNIVEQELLALERQYWQAMKDKDADAAMRLSDEACLITGAQRVTRMDKHTLKGLLKAAPYTLHDEPRRRRRLNVGSSRAFGRDRTSRRGD